MKVRETIDDVLALYKDAAEGVIILKNTAGGTGIIPILTKISGIVCTEGGLSSHLAILAREFQIPCVVGTKINCGSGLDGKKVRIKFDGTKAEILVMED
jgi:phosphohistidine swiveling domain-containing protein